MARTLDAAINELLQDYKKAIAVAVDDASKRATTDIWKHSLTCLDEYYEAYEPNSYNRSDSLWSAFLPYQTIVHGKDEIVSTVGVEYNAGMLTTYTGSKKYTPTDGGWVLNNYLNGVHPGTNGGHTKETSWYDPTLFGQVDSPTPTDKMEKYINEYVKTFDRNVLTAFARQMRR